MIMISQTNSFTVQGLALIGAGIVLTFQGMQMYVIDAFIQYSASGQSP